MTSEFDIELTNGEEIAPETFQELSDGKGEDDEQQPSD